jgi:hypothetical protein
MSKPIPGIVSDTGFTYEISEVWTVARISEKGVRRSLKTDDGGRVSLAGKFYKVHDLAKLAGWSVKDWPEDDREWEEHAAILLTAHMNVPARLYGRTWIRAHFVI